MSRVTYHTAEKRSDYVEQTPPREDTWAWIMGNGGEVHVFEDILITNHSQFEAYLSNANIYAPNPWFGPSLLDQGFKIEDLVLSTWKIIPNK